MSNSFGGTVRLQFSINQVDLLAGTAKELIAPEDGFIAGLDTSVQIAVTTGGTVNVKTGDALGVTVGGIVQTIANSATKGTRQSTKSIKGDDSRAVKKGDRIAIQAASFATAGALEGVLTIQSIDS